MAASAVAVPAAAQEPVTRQEFTELQRQLRELRARIDSLTALVRQLEGRLAPAAADTAADPLAALRAAAAEAAGQPAEPPADDTAAAAEAPVRFAGRQRSQQALNPEITVTGDVLAAVDFDDPEHQNFVPREFELSMQSSLDPYSRAKIFIGHHVEGAGLEPFGHVEEEPLPGEPVEEEAHGGHAGEFALEEGYLQWVGLPGGFNVTLGRFRQRFGQLNRWHPHSLPGQSYPLPYVAFFGEEGLAQSGVSVHWLAPWAGFGTWELWTEVTASGNEALFGEASSPSVLGHLNAFWDLSRSTYFELGLTGMTGPDMEGDDPFVTQLAGADFTLSWRPPAMGRYREASLRGGAIYGSLAPVGANPGEAFGAFANAEYRLSRQWIIGGRYEYTQNPLAPSESAWLAAPTLTWWQSEYVRIRAEFDLLDRPDGEPLRLLVIQTTFAMGPHKHETY